MITLETACKLKKAGLVWEPALHDFFAIPDRELDDSVFVISDVQVTVESIFGAQVVSFQGASEWALDSLLKDEAVWLPSEEQLRDALEVVLLKAGESGVQLFSDLDGCRCMVSVGGERLKFSASQASEAYAKAFLFLLKEE